jgi:hypothetical protein
MSNCASTTAEPSTVLNMPAETDVDAPPQQILRQDISISGGTGRLFCLSSNAPVTLSNDGDVAHDLVLVLRAVVTPPVALESFDPAITVLDQNIMHVHLAAGAQLTYTPALVLDVFPGRYTLQLSVQDASASVAYTLIAQDARLNVLYTAHQL